MTYALRGGFEASSAVQRITPAPLTGLLGQTAPKTKRVLDQAMGGVLFIDEAYYLYRAADSKDYGQEAIDIMLQVMEKERDNLVVILAGYKDRMDDFFESNPGMHSRIAHHLDFAAYDADELVAIGRLMLEQSSYYLSPGRFGDISDTHLKCAGQVLGRAAPPHDRPFFRSCKCPE